MLIESYERRKDRAESGNQASKGSGKAKNLVSEEVQKDIVERTSVEGLLF